jgi:hypothetical protein
MQDAREITPYQHGLNQGKAVSFSVPQQYRDTVKNGMFPQFLEDLARKPVFLDLAEEAEWREGFRDGVRDHI